MRNVHSHPSCPRFSCVSNTVGFTDVQNTGTHTRNTGRSGGLAGHEGAVQQLGGVSATFTVNGWSVVQHSCYRSSENSGEPFKGVQ